MIDMHCIKIGMLFTIPSRCFSVIVSFSDIWLKMIKQHATIEVMYSNKNIALL